MAAPVSVTDRMMALVAQIEKAFSSETSWVRRAFQTVPRHRFIRRRGTASPEEFLGVDRHHPTAADLDVIYADHVVMIHHPPSSASQPYVVARMLEWLELRPGMKVLEIGTGSGFNAALLAEGTGDPRLVHTIDIQEDLVAEAREHLAEAGYADVRVRCGDGGAGWPAPRQGDAGHRADAGPFDRIIVTAGSGDLPPAWLDQLAEGGVLVMPLATPPVGDLQLRLRKHKGEVTGEFLDVFYFMSLQGAYHMPGAGTGTPTGAGVRGFRNAIRTAPGYSCGMSWAHRSSFWTFARGQMEWFARPVESWQRRGTEWVSAMTDPAAGLYVLHERGFLNAYGRPGPVWNFGALVERWKAHGWPTLTDYDIRVATEPVATGPGEWLDRRPSVTLRMRLKGDKPTAAT